MDVNLVIVFNKNRDKVLMCQRRKDAAGSKNQSDSISHEQLYIEGGCLSYGSSGCGTGRFFGSDDRDSRTYVRKLLLLFER